MRNREREKRKREKERERAPLGMREEGKWRTLGTHSDIFFQTTPPFNSILLFYLKGNFSSGIIVFRTALRIPSAPMRRSALKNFGILFSKK